MCFMIIADLGAMSLLCYCLGTFEFSAIVKRLMSIGFVLSSAEIIRNTSDSFYNSSCGSFITMLLKSTALVYI